MTDPQTFGAWLQRERERRDVTMHAIAERTKIGVGLLQALERGDVSRWPGGIYRRSFVRSYAEAIGLDADLVLANFERLFPEPEMRLMFDRVETAAQRVATDPAALRLQFASPPRPGPAAFRMVAFDMALMVSAALVGLVVAGAAGFWAAAALTALACHVCSMLGLRRAIKVPVANLVQHWTAPRARAREMVAELADLPEPQADSALDLTYYAR